MSDVTRATTHHHTISGCHTRHLDMKININVCSTYITKILPLLLRLSDRQRTGNTTGKIIKFGFVGEYRVRVKRGFPKAFLAIAYI